MPVRDSARTVFRLLTAVVPLLAGSLVSASDLPVAVEGTTKPPPPPRVMGVGSCAASNCHGGVAVQTPTGGLTGVHGAEYTIWFNRDPHAKAFATLYSERSKEMARLLWPGQNRPAHKQAECLACHSLEFNPDKIVPGREQLVEADGVSCEACHGPAEHWLAKHVQAGFRQVGREWEFAPTPESFAARFKESEQLQSIGLWNTDNLKTRGQQCVRCHVGPSHGYDMNHDLIAAGHPRLAFEFASYASRLPAHWNTQAEKAAQPLLTARTWAMGQVLVAEASLKLLKHRAQASAGEGPAWPEFAEYDCYACHHGLGQKGRAEARASGLLSNGLYRWGAWNTPLLVTATSSPVILEEGSPLLQLRTEMQKEVPDRTQVITLATKLHPDDDAAISVWQAMADGLNNDAEKGIFDLTTASVREKLDTVLASGTALKTASWDEMAQHYLAIRALYEALAQANAPEVAGVDHVAVRLILRDLRGTLVFPTSFESPLGFEPAKAQALFIRLYELFGGK